MAEAEKKKEAAPAKKEEAPKKEAAAPEEKKKGGLLSKTPVLLGGVMVLEAVVLFAGFKFFVSKGPQTAAGAEVQTESKDDSSSEDGKPDPKKPTELPIVEFRAPNKQSGRTFLYDVSIYAVTKKGQDSEKIKKKIAEHDATIKDRIRTIIAQSDPEKLGGGSEPGLETLRRQIKFQLDEIIGDGQVEEILIPRCIPFRADY
jgi:flagellar basal body-associated protein FliL